MGARAIWKGSLVLGRQRVPVKLYSAVEDASIHFHLLEARTRSRVKQRMVDPESGKEIPKNQIRKAHEIEPGVFVIIDKEEIDELTPEGDRNIELIEFLPPGKINHQWYEQPYYLGPDGDAGSYFALVEALNKQNKEGLAKWVMRKKQYFGSLQVQGDYLALITLRSSEEVLLPRDLPAPSGKGATKAELNMAEELVAILEGEFNPEDFHDEYRERVLEFVEARARGKRPRLETVKEKRGSKSLEGDLARSIAAMSRAKEKAVA